MASTSAESPPKKRRRPALACKQCRRRKMKCDQNRPTCNNCSKSSIDCAFPTDNQLPESPATVSDASRFRTRPIIARALAPPIPPSNSSKEHLMEQISQLQQTIELLQRGDRPKKPDAIQGLPPGPRFSNQSSWMNCTSLYWKVLRTLSKAQAEKGDLYQSLIACKRLGQQINQQTSTVNAEIPPKAEADHLLDLYCRNFDGPFRILHLPSFRGEYENYWNTVSVAAPSETFRLKMLVCLALGAAVHDEPSRWRDYAILWVTEARTWLARPPGPVKRKQSSFEELQLACLVCVAEVIDSHSEQFGWLKAGELVRKAMALNLHREEYLQHLPLQQAEMRRRLWATVLELNLMLSLQADRPPLISPSDYDAKAPSAMADEELEGRQVSDKTSNTTASNVQAILFESFTLRLSAVSRITSVKSISYEETLRLHGELVKARKRLPSGLDSYSVLACIIFSRYLLSLHLPLLATSIREPAHHFSRRACISTAVEMVRSSGIISEAARGDVGPNEIHRLFTNSAGMFRHLVMQPIFAIAFELVTAREEDTEGAATFSAWDEDDLARYLAKAQSWAESRIRNGPTDVHTCCFLAACRAYADAPGGGPQGMIDAALESSERCRQILNEVAKGIEQPPQVSTTESVFDTASISLDWFGDFPADGLGDDWTINWAFPTVPEDLIVGNADT